MSLWQDHNIAEKVTQILADVPEYDPVHHLGHPFLSAYQIAIEFKRRHPDVYAELGYPVGGRGTGQKNSLAQYLAGELSRRIHRGQITHIDGGFLSNLHLHDIQFSSDGGDPFASSLTGTAYTLSLFRLRNRV